MSKEDQLEQAYLTLRNYIKELAYNAGEEEGYAEELWQRIRNSNGIMRELAYYHDYHSFLGEYKVAGYSLIDILVWQVDHFKAYLDRREEVNRYKRERLLLKSLEVLAKMEMDPVPYIDKLRGETGTDIIPD